MLLLCPDCRRGFGAIWNSLRGSGLRGSGLEGLDPSLTKGYCEWCGQRPSWHERLRGIGLAPNQDGTLLLCADCRPDVEPAAILKRRNPRPRLSPRKYQAAAGVVALAAVFAVVVLYDSTPSSGRTGGVLGAFQPGPRGTVADSTRLVASPPPEGIEPTTRGSGALEPSSPAASNDGHGPAHTIPAVSISRPAIRTWEDSFGRSRLQVIWSVRNEDTGWLRLPATRSTYQIRDGAREVASGTLTALPAVIGPGETAYLVDTINIPAVELARALWADSDVAVVPTEPRAERLSVTRLRLTSGVGGGMKATGQVRNLGRTATRPVIAGAVALDRQGWPLAAVYDTVDVGRVDPGEARPFATDYDPGAPPVNAISIGQAVAVAFETDP